MLHERSARLIGNKEEADRYAEQIATLRTKHEITQEIVIDEEDYTRFDDYDGELVFGEDSPMFRRKRIVWEENLCAASALFFDCRSVSFKRSNIKVVIGEKTNRKKVIDSYLFLYELANKKSAEYLEARANTQDSFYGEHKRTARECFLLGFAWGIVNRFGKFKEMEQELRYYQKRLGGDQAEESGQGLVKSEKIVDTKKRAQINEEVSNLKAAPKSQIKKVDETAGNAGVKFGLECELPEEIQTIAKEVLEQVDKLREQIRRERVARYGFYSGTGTVYIYPPVQMKINFNDTE